MILPDLRCGGAQKVFLSLAHDFIKRDIRVDLLVILVDGELEDEVPQGVRLIPLTHWFSSAGKLGAGVEAFYRLWRYLRASRPHAILSTLTATNILAISAHTVARVQSRLVVRETSSVLNLRHSVYKYLMRVAYNRADAVVALTSVMREELAKVISLDRQQIVNIPNTVDRKLIDSRSQAALPKTFDASCPFVLSVGRLAPPKDFGTLIKAFALIPPARSLQLVILGDGPDRSMLELLTESLSLAGRVTFCGFDPNPYRWMAKASVFVLSSHWEGYPNVILEARALSVPIVITNYNESTREVGGNTAIRVPVSDAHAMANGITKALSDSHSATAPDILPQGVTCMYLKTLGF